ncbi:hypothetical protein CY35_03G122400 [Sphagnum magellanicum]|nr:hypothetical protein CY35_03G122400 [Sphagnum magellanicum]
MGEEVSGVAFLVLYQASTKEMGLVEMVRLKIAAMEASRTPYSSSRSGSRTLLHDVDTHIRSGDTLAPDSLFPTPWACTSRRQT